IQVDGSRGARVSRFKQQLVSGARPRSPSGTLPPSSPTLRSTLAPSSSSDPGSARIGTAALLHDNGALLIIGDSVHAQVMTATMYLLRS
ncbi:Hypothetical predicted protein, partial [Xyrichtys novacula]